MSRDILELGSSLGYLDELYELQQSEPGAVDPSWNALIGPVATPTTQPANGTPKTNGQGAKAPTIASPALTPESIAGPALPGRAAPPYGGAESI
ncbi:MAG TPA: hypothetical protein VF403_17030, partial [Kofleriaceae bacterium]